MKNRARFASKALTILILAALQFSAAATVAIASDGNESSQADLSSTKAQAIFLWRLHRTLPEVFDQPARFDADPIIIASDQSEIREQLVSHPIYRPLMALRPAPISMKIEILTGKSETSSHIDPRAIEEWRSELEGKAQEIAQQAREKGRTFSKQLKKQVAKTHGSDVYLLQLYVLTSLASSERDGSVSFEETMDSLSHLGETDLDLFRERAVLNQALPLVLGSGNTAAIESALALLEWHAAQIESKRIETIEKASGTFYIEEVGPDVATFRGFVGDDCATKYSAFYPNLPTERTFFIYDQDRHPLGYAAATHVRHRDLPSLYLHTINGPAISKILAMEILSAFHQSRKALEVEQIVIPTSKRIHENMNYAPIMQAYETFLPGTKKRFITYLDHALRSLVDQTTESHYDRASANRLGHAIQASSSDERGVRVTLYESPDLLQARSDLPTQPSQGEILLLANVFAKQRRAFAARQILSTFDLSPFDYDSLSRAVGNDLELPIAEYYKNFIKVLVSFGTIPDTQLLRDYRAQFVIGQIKASDAFEGGARAGAMDLLLDLMKKGTISEILPQIKRVSSLLDSNPKFLTMVRSSSDFALLNLMPTENLSVQAEVQRRFRSRLHAREKALPAATLLIHGKSSREALEVTILAFRHQWIPASISTHALKRAQPQLQYQMISPLIDWAHASNDAQVTILHLISEVAKNEPLDPKDLPTIRSAVRRISYSINEEVSEAAKDLLRKLTQLGCAGNLG